jgi:23S rRNA (cytosine1962-C5)-methyltransferase
MNVLTSTWPEYELLDSGNEQKLERFGKYVLVRPENQAIWRPSYVNREWERADAVLEKAPNRRGEWKYNKKLPKNWIMPYKDINFSIQITPFGHIGVFPEQSEHWSWIAYQIDKAKRPISVLNLFGYTGGSTLAAAAAGAQVTHVDASKPAVSWASENVKLSGLEKKPIRWIVDDAFKFVEREARRGTKYDAIIMDPPKFGRGPGGEVWQFEKSFIELLKSCRKVLSPNPVFTIMTVYAVPFSSLSIGNVMEDFMTGHNGKIDSGELTLRETSGKRLLSTSVYSRWSCL